jgi:hypothetical protein
MMFYFDTYGWLSPIPNAERQTDITPPAANGDQRPNWTGTGWVLATYTAPVAPPAPPGSTIITPLAFRNRFTQAEKVTIEIACLDVPTAAMSARQQAAALRVSQADTAAASYIDLSRADTRAGVQALQTAGIIAAGRAAVILDTPVADIEKPRS